MSPDSASSSEAAWTATDLSADPHAAPDKADRVRRMFAAIAPRYDLNNRLHSLGRDQAWRRAAVRRSGAGPGEDVLDVACGTGDLTEAFARARPRSVTGVDFTEEMLDLARRKAASGRRPDGSPTPVYALADATALPFADASFDVVSIAFGIRNVNDPDAALAEFRRVLRPGGRLVILEFGRPGNPVLRRLNDFYCGSVMPVTASLLAGDRSGAYRYLPRSVATFPEREALVARLREAGFARTEFHPMTLGIAIVYVGRVEAETSGGSRTVDAGGPGAA